MIDSRRLRYLSAYRKYIRSFRARQLPFWHRFAKGILLSMPGIYAPQINNCPCDLLFIHEYIKGAARIRHWCAILEKSGLRIEHELLDRRHIIKHRMMAPVDYRPPQEFHIEACFARYIAEKYRPKITITFMDASPLSFFLHEELKHLGSYINIAHGITGASALFSMYDFDYYFAFGQSSLGHMLGNAIRYGTTKAVLTGSPFISRDFYLPPIERNQNVLFFSNWLPPELRESIIATTELVIRWAKQNSRFTLYIKPHPLENISLVRRLTSGMKNVRILEHDVSIKNALISVSLALLTPSSCASLEAALLNRPAIVVDANNEEDRLLNFQRFFLPHATTMHEIEQRIEEAFKARDQLLSRGKDFLKYHLEHTYDSGDFIAECIQKIYAHNEDFFYHPISEKLEGLERYIN
jgi:hypothetical protein